MNTTSLKDEMPHLKIELLEGGRIRLENESMGDGMRLGVETAQAAPLVDFVDHICTEFEEAFTPADSDSLQPLRPTCATAAGVKATSEPNTVQV